MSDATLPGAAGSVPSARALEAVVTASPLPIISVDLMGRVTSWNPAATELFGWREEEVLGTPLPVVPPGRREEAQGIRTRTEEGETFHDVEVLRQRRDGTLVPLSLSTAPLTDEQGRPVGSMLIYVDLRARKVADEALHQQAAALRERAALLDLTQDAIFVRELETGIIRYWNTGAERLYGWTKQDAIGAVTHELLQTVFPEPLDEIKATLRRTGRWSGDLLHTARDGRRLIVASRWALHEDDRGAPIGALEVNTDVTQARRMEEALRESQERLQAIARERTAALEHIQQSEEQLRTLIAQAPVGICVVTVDGIFEQVNDAYAAILGYQAGELVGKDVSIVIPAEQLKAVTESRRWAFETGTTSLTEAEVIRKDGRRVTLLTTAIPVSSATDEHRRVSFALDITERKEAERILAHQAHHDALTGLVKRVELKYRLDIALRNASRAGEVVAALFVDLDGFKAVNDQFGHEEGDALLVRVAEHLVSAVRASDTAARLAGDEFVLVLPNIGSTHNAVAVATKMLASFQQLTAGQPASSVSASIGISLYPFDGQTAEELLQCADAAMYRAKSRGKNGYALYSED